MAARAAGLPARKVMGIAALVCGLGGGHVHAADRALVMTIGNYPGNAALPGVSRDRDSALRMMQRLGFAPQPGDVHTPADAALDAAGLHRTLGRLVDEVQPGDRVFLYYSGHGTSSLVEGQCEQGLLAQDGRVFSRGEMARYLDQLTGRAGQVVMVLDACFSGGVAGVGARRSITGLPQTLRPKFSAAYGDKAAGAADHCATPSNFVVEPPRRRGAVNLERNFLYIAAAREDEVAFDHEEQGGLATTALLRCLDRGAGQGASADFKALAACAQAGVEQALPPDPRLKPQHLVLVGNPDLVVQRAGLAPANITTPGASTGSQSVLLARILGEAESAWSVQLRAQPSTLKIRQDMLSLQLTSSRDGYFSLFYLGSDAQTWVQLYPTRSSDANHVRAGQPIDIPRRWRSEGPAGVNQIVAVVASRPRALSEWTDGGSDRSAGRPGCTRNLAAQSDCAAAAGIDDGPYGAVHLRVQEVP